MQAFNSESLKEKQNQIIHTPPLSNITMMRVRFCNLKSIPETDKNICDPITLTPEEFQELCDRESLEYSVWYSGPINTFMERDAEYDYHKKHLMSLPGYNKLDQLTFRGIFVETQTEHQYECYSNCNYKGREDDYTIWENLGRQKIRIEKGNINRLKTLRDPYVQTAKEIKTKIKLLKIEARKEMEKNAKNSKNGEVALLDKLTKEKKELTQKIASMEDWIKANRPTGKIMATKMNEIESVKRSLRIVTQKHSTLMRKLQIITAKANDSKEQEHRDQIMELECEVDTLKRKIASYNAQITAVWRKIQKPVAIIGYQLQVREREAKEVAEREKREREIARLRRMADERERQRVKASRTFSEVASQPVIKRSTENVTIETSSRWKQFEGRQLTRNSRHTDDKDEDEDDGLWSRGTKVIDDVKTYTPPQTHKKKTDNWSRGGKVSKRQGDNPSRKSESRWR